MIYLFIYLLIYFFALEKVGFLTAIKSTNALFVCCFFFFSLHIVKCTGKLLCDDKKIAQKHLIVPQNMVFPVFCKQQKIDFAKRNSQKPTLTKTKYLLLISQNNTTKKRKMTKSHDATQR